MASSKLVLAHCPRPVFCRSTPIPKTSVFPLARPDRFERPTTGFEVHYG